MKKMKRQKAVCLLFFMSLCTVWAAGLFRKDKVYSAWEKRMLAQRPEAELAAVLDGSYGEDYEEWLSDQFPGRDWWVDTKTRCELLLGKREVNGIYMGKDGYLFSESREPVDWDGILRSMEEEFGAEHVSRIHAPNAGTVLIRKLPPAICFPGTEDGVLRALLAHQEEYIYFRTDHHWTMLGAYYAYAEWIKERGMEPVPLKNLEKQILKEDFLGTHYSKLHYAKEADVMEFYGPGTDCTAVYDLGQSEVSGLYQEKYLGTEDAYRFFLDGNHGLVEIETGQEGGHLAVLKDSFANCFVPFLTLHYSRITVIDPRNFRADIREWLSGQGVTEVLVLAQDGTEASYVDGCPARTSSANGAVLRQAP